MINKKIQNFFIHAESALLMGVAGPRQLFLRKIAKFKKSSFCMSALTEGRDRPHAFLAKNKFWYFFPKFCLHRKIIYKLFRLIRST